MRKRSIHSPLDLLPLHQKQALAGWLTTGGPAGVGISYTDAARRLRSEFGIKTSVPSLCQWRKRNLRAAGIAATGKPVVRSPLDRLPREIRDALFTWLTAGGDDGRGITYAQAATRLRADFGLTFGITAICKFFKRHQRADALGIARVTTAEAGEVKIITLETTSCATVETIQDAQAKTLILKITLPT